MQTGSPLLLASIDSIRPVFLIVMGVSLLMLAWRLSKDASRWSGRFIFSGAILLAIGYSFVMPLYEAGKIERSQGETGSPPTPEYVVAKARAEALMQAAEMDKAAD